MEDAVLQPPLKQTAFNRVIDVKLAAGIRMRLELRSPRSRRIAREEDLSMLLAAQRACRSRN